MGLSRKHLVVALTIALAASSIKAFRPAEPPSVLENKGYDQVAPSSHSSILADEYRLPLEVTPSLYEIRVKPQIYDANATDFLQSKSKVTIFVKSNGNSRTITLHSDPDFVEIDHAGVKVTRIEGDQNIPVVGHSTDTDKHFYVIQLGLDLVKDQYYDVEIPYVARLADTSKGGSTNGIFAATYTDPDSGETRYMAATHFEPARARKAFPCFDEPNLKAIFDVIIGRKDSYHSLANMDLSKTEDDPDNPEWKWDYYKSTDIQSTYLVCFAVSDFVSVEAPAGIYGKPVKIWAAKYLIDQQGGVFAAEATAKVLKYFNETLGIDYKYPKMDSIAVPPFGGAMENWGLVVYGVSALMYIPGKSNENNKRSISNVIGHELAHQWFGNLVTCHWWSDIWLNEGFATYFSFQAEHAVTPELEPLERIYLDVIPAAMGYDHGPSTHPVKSDVDNPVTGAKFDTMVYEKGGAIIRMMEATFGRDKMIAGFAQYLNEMSFKPAEQDDLFARLQLNVNESLPADLTVKDFLDTWTLQSGYPLLRVSNISGVTLYVSQERYIADRSVNSAAASKELTTWHIPLRVATKGSPNDYAQHWLKKDQLTMSLSSVNTGEWIVINPDAAGYYRVLYDESMLKLLWDQLNTDHAVFTPITRAKFMDDYFNFATAGHADVEQALEFTKYLGKETKRVPWSNFLIHFARFADLVEESPTAKNVIYRYLTPRFDELFSNIGLEQTEDANGHTVILRNAIFERACPLRYPGCLSYGDQIFQAWKNAADGENPTPIDLRTVLYCGAVAGPNGGAAFEFFLEKSMTETDSAHRNQLISALPCAMTEADHSRLLRLIEDPNSGIDKSYNQLILQRMVSESVGRGLALAYIKSNLGGPIVTPQVYSSVISTLSNYAYRDTTIQNIVTHMELNKEVLKDVYSSLESSINKMKSNGEWMVRVGNPAITWMGRNLNSE